MSRIDQKDLCILKTAAEIRTVANDADKELELSRIAFAINTAANSGEYQVEWVDKISDDAKTALESKGYTLETKIVALSTHYIIKWEASKKK